jgi:hypothetical protein
MGQRETIQRARGRLKDVEAGLRAGGTLLARMALQASQSRAVLLAVAEGRFLCYAPLTSLRGSWFFWPKANQAQGESLFCSFLLLQGVMV